MAQTKDLLSLVNSNNVSITGMQEVAANLQLSSAPNPSTSINGTVKNNTTAIENATVKLFTGNDNTPYAHTTTSEDGSFSFIGIDAGTYQIGVTAPGYILSTLQNVTVAAGESQTATFNVTPEATLSLGAIVGMVKDNKGAAIGGTQVTLIDKVTSASVAVTTTINDGEFAFYDISNGTYTVTFSKFGYLNADAQEVTVSDTQKISNLTATMTIDDTNHKGTVSGIITDINQAIVANSFVGLYSVTTVGEVTTEALIAVTKTNSAGQYMFANVDAGTYVVKAKKNAV